MADYNITNYRINISQGQEQGRYIFLFDVEGQYRATLLFTAPSDDVTIKVNYPSQDSEVHHKTYFIYFPENYFADVVDLLRNEKPINLHISRDEQTIFLETDYEPVGEGEIEMLPPGYPQR